MTSTPTCSGHCGAAAATSASSPRSSSPSTPLGHRPGRAILWDATDAGRSSASIATSSATLRRARTLVRFGAAPPLPVIPRSALSPGAMVGACYAGPIEDGEQTLRPLRAFAFPCSTWSGPALRGIPHAPLHRAARLELLLEVHPPPRASRRPHRRDRRARVLLLVAAVVRGDVPSQGGGGAAWPWAGRR